MEPVRGGGLIQSSERVIYTSLGGLAFCSCCHSVNAPACSVMASLTEIPKATDNVSFPCEASGTVIELYECKSWRHENPHNFLRLGLRAPANQSSHREIHAHCLEMHIHSVSLTSSQCLDARQGEPELYECFIASFYGR